MVVTHDADWSHCIQGLTNCAGQIFNGGFQDMTVYSEPEDPGQIFASILATNDIREDEGTCLNTPEVFHCPYAIQESYILNQRCLVR